MSDLVPGVVLISPLPTPIEDLYVTSPYGMRADPKTGRQKMHHGVDFRAAAGTPIYAVADGTVYTVGENSNSSYGYYVRIEHKQFDAYTLYAHMQVNPSNYVSEEQKVYAGQQIGVVGSTGYSTGPHLHLEFSIANLSTVDPLPYITGTSSSSSGLNDYNSSGDIIDYPNEYVPATQIVGRRVSSLAPQPLQSFVHIYIGDKLLSSSPSRPNILQDFEITRLRGAGDKASFTIFDDNWDEIEYQFINNWKNIRIRYGYVNSQLVSPTYEMTLSNYSMSFTSTGVILSVQGISQGTVANMNQITVDIAKEDPSANPYNPTDAIKVICRAAEYIVEDENFDKTQDAPVSFSFTNELPVSFINENILPYAFSLENNSEMIFYIDSNRKAYLKEVTFVPDDVANKIERTYVYQKGYDSVVDSIEFDIKGRFGGSTMYKVASGLQSALIDPYTKEENSQKETMKTVLENSSVTGQYSTINSEQSTPFIDPAGYTNEQLKSRLYYDMIRSSTRQYEADMSIIGDPTIKLLESIRVINVTDKGYLHHTSGIYLVSGIIDSVRDGVMKTDLHLIRNGDIEHGVELINPKRLLK